jgi:hypothetical protein
VNETYQFYVSMLEERRAELTRELEQAYSTKQVALSVYSQKAQETVDKIFQVIKLVHTGNPLFAVYTYRYGYQQSSFLYEYKK